MQLDPLVESSHISQKADAVSANISLDLEISPRLIIPTIFPCSQTGSRRILFFAIMRADSVTEFRGFTYMIFVVMISPTEVLPGSKFFPIHLVMISLSVIIPYSLFVLLSVTVIEPTFFSVMIFAAS